MCNSVSRQTIRRANRSLIDNRLRSFSSSNGQAEMSSRTTYGPRTIQLSTQKILDAANSVMESNNSTTQNS